MANNKVILDNEDLQNEYLVAKPKNVKHFITAIDIVAGLLGLLGCIGTGLYPLLYGITNNILSDTVAGCVFMGAALLCLIHMIVAIVKKGKNRLTGFFFPLTIVCFNGGMCALKIYEYMTHTGASGTFRMICIYGGMTVLAIIAMIFYFVKSKSGGIGPRLISFGFAAGPAFYVIFRFYYNFKIVLKAAVAFDPNVQNTLVIILLLCQLIGMFFVAVGMFLLEYGAAARLVDRGDNCVVIEKEVVTKEVPVEVIKHVQVPAKAKPRANGLLIIKSKKAPEAAPTEEVK